MFKNELRNEIATIYNKTVSDFGGEFDAGANAVYINYGDVSINQTEGESVTFDVELDLMILATKDSVYFGLITLPFLKYSNTNKTNLKPVGITEEITSISVDTVSIAKSFTYTVTMEYDKIRQMVTEIYIDPESEV